MRTLSTFALILTFGISAAAHAELVRQNALEPGKVYRGSMPENEEDMAKIQAMGVKTIVSFQQAPWHYQPERQLAHKYGIHFIRAGLMAAPWEPDHENIKKALLAISNPENQPVYFHCKLGRDRTGLIAGLYRVYFQGWTPERAFKDEMQFFGFNESFTMAGLKHYYWEHTQEIPNWAKRPAEVPGASSTEVPGADTETQQLPVSGLPFDAAAAIKDL